jgi:hypothetical protein
VALSTDTVGGWLGRRTYTLRRWYRTVASHRQIRESSDLRSDLDSLRNRLDLLGQEAEESDVDIARYLEHARGEVRLADWALGGDSVVSYWRHFAEAKKGELAATERLYRRSMDDEHERNLLEDRAQDARLQAADVLDRRQRERGEAGLSHTEPRERYYRSIVSAIHLIHQQHIADSLERKRGRPLESQPQFFMTVIVACLVSLFYVWFVFFGAVGVVETTDLFSLEFILTAVLFGAMGAAVSSLTNLSRVLQDADVPERVGNVRLAVAWVVLGAASALILYIFVFAEIVNVFVVSASSLLAVAFVSGFSERLLVRTVRNFTGDENDRTDGYTPEEWFEGRTGRVVSPAEGLGDDTLTRRSGVGGSAEGRSADR